MLFSLGLLISLLNCSRRPPTAITELEPEPTPTLMPGYGAVSGTLTLPVSADAEGKAFHIFLFNEFNGFNNADAVFTGIYSSAAEGSFYLPVSTGHYYMAVYIETGENSSSYAPSAGDLVGLYGVTWPEQPQSQNITVEDGEITITDVTLVEAFDNIVGGADLTLYEPAPGKELRIVLDHGSDPENPSIAGFKSITLEEGQSSLPYSLFTLFPGSYYLYGWVDTDNNSLVNSGDMLGYCSICPSCVGGNTHIPRSYQDIYIYNVDQVNIMSIYFYLNKIP